MVEGNRTAAINWQAGIWDRMSNVYVREIDRRFAPVVDYAIQRAGPAPGETVLDIGTGTGAVAIQAARLVGDAGRVLAIDISPDMLGVAAELAERAGASVDFEPGSAERIPAPDRSIDVVIASLSFMYVIDRDAAAVECARVLKPGGRFVAAVWGGPERCDIVRFQSIAGSFAPEPPVTGVGPGALADPSPLLEQLAAAGIDAHIETETVLFEFPSLEHAWQPLASVTTAGMPNERVVEAKAAIQAAMWPDPEKHRVFENLTQFIVGSRR